MADRNSNLGNGGSSSRSDNRDLNEESGVDRSESGFSGSSKETSGNEGLGGSQRPDRSGTSGDDLNRDHESGMSGSESDRNRERGNSENPERNRSDSDIGESNR
jgi:hypothetical protein